MLIAMLLQIASLFSCPSANLDDSLKWLLSDDFGYTLLGEKPVSVVQSLPRYIREHPERKEQLFEFLRQAFSQSQVFIFKLISEQGDMELIHVPSLLYQVRKNKCLSDFVRKKYRCEENFIRQLKNPALNIFRAVDHSPILIAILLGYGKENGVFFARWVRVGSLLQKYPVVSFFPFDRLPDPEHIKQTFSEYDCLLKLPAEEASDRKKLEEEWASLVAMKRPDQNNVEPPFCISTPAFISKLGRESDLIHKRFEKARIQLADLLNNHHATEIVLTKALQKKAV